MKQSLILMLGLASPSLALAHALAHTTAHWHRSDGLITVLLLAACGLLAAYFKRTD